MGPFDLPPTMTPQHPRDNPPGPAASREGKSILVTGAAGFIGSHVCEALLARGRAVVGLDNFDPYYDPAIKRRNLGEVRAASPAGGTLEFVQADICDAPAIRALLERTRPEGIIHLAAKAGVRPSIADPAGYSRANVFGTSVMLEEARRAGVGRFVMASSSSVYGNSPKAPFSETDDVSEPISPYAATKRACELIGHAHWHLTRMPTACLRFFTVFGPRQRPDLAISLFLNRISRGETIEVFGDGSTSRDYTYISDIVAGVLSAYDRIDRFGYRVWNLGHSEPVTLGDMIATIARTVGREPKIVRKPAQPGDVERTYADLTRSAAELDFRPRTPFAEGVRGHWEWMRSLSAPASV
jgi:UDP-glucuronate 4-epimerase